MNIYLSAKETNYTIFVSHPSQTTKLKKSIDKMAGLGGKLKLLKQIDPATKCIATGWIKIQMSQHGLDIPLSVSLMSVVCVNKLLREYFEYNDECNDCKVSLNEINL